MLIFLYNKEKHSSGVGAETTEKILNRVTATQNLQTLPYAYNLTPGSYFISVAPPQPTLPRSIMNTRVQSTSIMLILSRVGQIKSSHPNPATPPSL